VIRVPGGARAAARAVALAASLVGAAACGPAVRSGAASGTLDLAEGRYQKVQYRTPEGLDVGLVGDGRDLVVERGDRRIVLKDAAALGKARFGITGVGRIEVEFTKATLILEDRVLEFAGKKHLLPDAGSYALEPDGSLSRGP